MQQLNPQQLEAVTYLGGPLLVIAGAGSGKTGVITQKIAYLVQKTHYEARGIYAVTFTNKAAREMSERTRKILGKAARGLNISTFHRLGLTILQQEHRAANLRKNFTIFDARDSANLIKDLTQQEEDTEIRQVAAQISAYKNAGLSPAKALGLAGDELQRRAAVTYQHYQERLQAYNAVDFDDLIARPLQLFKSEREVRERWQMHVRYLLIDEYQDTNSCQYQLMQLLVGASGAFTAVGDDDQSIYAWRGAQPENLTHLHEDYPTLKTIKLEQNYRCHQNILHAANHLIAHNPHLVEKKLWSTLSEGEGIHVIAARNEEMEAEKIVENLTIRRLRSNRPFKDFAILYRSNFQARVLEQQLRAENIAYTISGGTSFFDHSEIRDLLSYLRLLNNPDDDAAFLRVVNTPKREIGPATLGKLGEYAARRGVSLFTAATEVGFASVIDRRAGTALGEFIQWIQTMMEEAESTLPSDLLKQMIRDMDYEGHLFQLHKAPAKVEARQKRIGQLIAWIMKLQEDTVEDPRWARG